MQWQRKDREMADKKRNSTVVCTGYALGETKNGYPQMIIDLRICEGPRAGEQLTMYRVVMMDNPDSLKKAADILTALGREGGTFAEPVGLGRTKANCLEVEDTYDGKTSWKAIWVSAKKPRGNTISEDNAEKLEALMASVLDQQQPLEVTDDNKAPTELPEVTHTAAPTSNSPEDIFS